MSDAAHRHGGQCEWEHAAATYLDGELEHATAAIFEAHAKACEACTRSLREQRRLLCLLDNAFDETFNKKVTLPSDFTRVVKARAQTDMSGVRARRERAISLKICLTLVCAIFVLLGTPAFDALSPVMDAARALVSVAGIAAHAAADAGAGALVIARAVSGRFVADSNTHAFLQWVLFACALALLLRLIGRYHRARVND